MMIDARIGQDSSAKALGLKVLLGLRHGHNIPINTTQTSLQEICTIHTKQTANCYYCRLTAEAPFF